MGFLACLGCQSGGEKPKESPEKQATQASNPRTQNAEKAENAAAPDSKAEDGSPKSLGQAMQIKDDDLQRPGSLDAGRADNETVLSDPPAAAGRHAERDSFYSAADTNDVLGTQIDGDIPEGFGV